MAGARVRTILLSPHFDDVALSCGGTAALAATGEMCDVVTVMAARPPGDLSAFARFQHDRWGTRDDAVDQRREEDSEAMQVLGATPVWLDFPDAIYRGDLYLSDENLFGQVKPGDADTASDVRRAITRLVEERGPVALYAPAGIGGHVDHRLTRDAAIACLEAGIELFLYEDFPYSAGDPNVERWLAELPVRTELRLIDVTSTIETRVRAIAAYRSQLPTIFRHHGDWESAVRQHASGLSDRPGGYAERFWRVVH